MTIAQAADGVENLAATVTGRIATPADPDWDAVRMAWNLSIDQQPVIVAFPEGSACEVIA